MSGSHGDHVGRNQTFWTAEAARFAEVAPAGFDVEDLVEIYAPASATTRYPFVSAAWAQRWPVEEAWIARKP